MVVTVDDVRSFAMSLPRTTEAPVHDRVKVRVAVPAREFDHAIDAAFRKIAKENAVRLYRL